jgi:uncharacterized membrane protein
MAKSSPTILFLLLALPIYLAFALITPAFHTPDEHQHLFRAWQFSEGHVIAERRGDEVGGVLPGGLGLAAAPEIGSLEPHAARPLPKRPFTKVRSTAATEAPARYYNFFGSSIYSPAGYGPQVVAVWVGKATGLSVENIVRLGRVLNALLAITLFAAAIRLTPWGSSVFLYVGLFPMTAASAAALGQDGLINSGGCLLAALGLRAAVAGCWTVRARMGALLLVSALTLSKIVYLPLALVGGWLRRKGAIRETGLLFLSCLVPALLTILWLSSSQAAEVDHLAAVPPAGERVASWIAEPSLLFAPLLSAFSTLPGLLGDTVFTFGWLSIGPIVPAQALCASALLCLFLAGGSERAGPSTVMRLWLIALGGGIAVGICLALLLTFTPAGSVGVSGLQGRYFIPTMALLLLALLPRRSFLPLAERYLRILLVGANALVLLVIAKLFYTF